MCIEKNHTHTHGSCVHFVHSSLTIVLTDISCSLHTEIKSDGILTKNRVEVLSDDIKTIVKQHF